MCNKRLLSGCIATLLCAVPWSGPPAVAEVPVGTAFTHQGDRAKKENKPRAELRSETGRLLRDSPGTSAQEGSGISAGKHPVKHRLGPGRAEALSRDDNANSIPDDSECPADLDCNSEVRVPDLIILLTAWGPNPGHPADLDGDGEVRVPDLIILLAAWGPCKTFCVHFPKLGFPPDEEGEGWIRPKVWGALDSTATDDTITVPNGRPIYALIVSGYESNKYLDELMVYNFARHLMARGAYVHYAWWNNLLAPYMERPLHHPQSDPGVLDFDTLIDFSTAEQAAEKAFPGEDYQFVADAKLFLSAIREHNPSAIIIVVGHSMGGGAIVHLASQTDVVLDIVAPIDPVGNRNYPWSPRIPLDICVLQAPVPLRDFNWTRWRVTRDRFLGYKSLIRDGLQCVPDGDWLKDVCEINNSLFCALLIAVHDAPTLEFGSHVINLHHRYQQEALFPFDFSDAYSFGHTPPPGGTTNQAKVPMTPDFEFSNCGILRCEDPGGWPFAVFPPPPCCPDGDGVGWDSDGHGEIIGSRGPFIPIPLGVRVRTSPQCGDCPNQTWPGRSGSTGNWSNGDGLERKRILKDLENRPANFVWEHRPTNPDLCLVSQGLIDLFEVMNRPPEAHAGEDQIVECMGRFGAEVTLDGSGSSDPDDDALTYLWTWSSGSASGAVTMVTLPLGTYRITLTVRDPSGHIDTDVVVVTVQDTTAPELFVDLSPSSLWPPNHKLVDIQATVATFDLCSDVAVELVSIVSNEADDGLGDGHTTGDIMGADMNTLDLFFQLRAERAGGGHGRVYTVTYQATDDSGNRTETSAEVLVRH